MNHVAIVVSTVGFHWEELFGGYHALVDGGCAVDLFTVDGHPARPDPMSVRQTGPAALFGLGMPARIAPATPRGSEVRRALDGVRPLAELDPERYDALYLPGGHGCLGDVNPNVGVHAVVRRLYQRGAVLAAVCHATSTFAFVTVGGRSIVAGHAMTGFPHALDRVLVRAGLVDRDFLPLPLVNDAELRRAGAKLSLVDEAIAVANPRYMRVSPPFITGVGPKAAARVGRAVVRALAEPRAAAQPAAA